MKIPIIGIHIMTNKTFEKEKAKVKSQANQMNNRTINNLAYNNARLRIALTDLSKRKN